MLHARIYKSVLVSIPQVSLFGQSKIKVCRLEKNLLYMVYL